ncbi:MAG TPA: serine/threonine-protein kinase [Polyangiaceae bacterium]|nr:serine/threonine-protein kinase [Polyangiaceae bacterium]
MLPDSVRDALAELATLDAAALAAAFGRRPEPPAPGPALAPPEGARAAAERLGEALPPLLRAEGGAASLAPLLRGPGGGVVLAWCEANAARRDVELSGLVAAAAAEPAHRARAVEAARARVVRGPLLDALGCAPLLGGGRELRLPENAEARARLEILIWEAGASGREVPGLGAWVWGSPETFDAVVGAPAHSALRGRVLSARALEIAASGLPSATDPALVGRTLQVLQPLLLHPEPLVWVHAARALGRLSGGLERLEGMVLDWALGDTQVLRQRAMTAFASLPAARLRMVAHLLRLVIDSPDEGPWVLAAIAAATPYLFFERPDLWGRLADRVRRGDGGAIAARALARGLATLWRRGDRRAEVEAPLRALRELGRSARPPGLDESRRWLEVIAVTDVVDGAERDPLDVELGLENLVRLAAQYDDEEADARAARFAASLGPAFEEARRLALGPGRVRQRAAAFNAVEGSARALALRLWAPLLATHPGGDAAEEPDLEATWKALARAPAAILDLVRERRRAGGEAEELAALEVLAVRLGGYALDACGEDEALGPGRGRTAHETCDWLHKIEGLEGDSRELSAPLLSALSTLLWRLVDTTRGTALGEVDDVRWLGPFAAWWALVIDRPAMLLQLATALPMMSAEALARCCDRAEALRTAIASGVGGGAWGPSAGRELAALHAGDTELGRALGALSAALADFDAAAGHRPGLEGLCTALVAAGERLRRALADPVKALRAEGAAGADGAPAGDAGVEAENASRVAALVARAIRAREPALLDVWFASLGPVASSLLEAAVRAAIRRSPPPPPSAKKEAKIVEGYELVQPLGEGGIGTVWLVRKPGADRLFVLKVPKVEALASANEVEREGILASFVEEAKTLAGIYHPNVASIIDRGVAGGAPFLVLEYLIGADLKQYSTARRMTLFELRQVVLDTCAGLAALHAAGFVHRDIKPANLWLRLPLSGGERFDAQKHRDPGRVPPLATVVIDFGMVRPARVAPGVGGKFVAGTAGYIAPEQVLDPVELDPRADVYALAGTLYNVTTGRAFFDDVQNPRDRIIAHMRRAPLDDLDRLEGFPAGVAKLLRAATAMAPQDRPSPLEFGREFAASL